MFGKKKEEWQVEVFGINVTFKGRGQLSDVLLKASALQDQNRRDYNDLYSKVNLILAEMNLTYQPETEKKEPARLVEKTEPIGQLAGYDFFVSDHPIFKTSATPKKKRGRPKKK